ncbi:MAG TPA: hypothetical protein DD401_07155 [Prevotella sp.]|nr:hypothetical protein [Porphyromonadaceae bacterium]HBN47352.1 hypothetical protein [Prevotella sp.]
MNTSANADMDEQKIKQDWEKAKAALGNAAGNNVPDTERKTALDKLIARYRSFVRLECLCIVLMPFAVYWLFSDNGILLPIYAAAFFLLAALVDHWLARRLAAIDIQRMNVTAVVRTALDCRKRHLQSMMLLIPLAVGFIGIIAYASINATHLLIGMAVGLAAGLALGIREFRAFMRDYRTAVADTEIHD